MYKVISLNILLRKKKRKFTKKNHTLYLMFIFFIILIYLLFNEINKEMQLNMMLNAEKNLQANCDGKIRYLEKNQNVDAKPKTD